MFPLWSHHHLPSPARNCSQRSAKSICVAISPRTLGQWNDYVAALESKFDAQDEALVDSLVRPGHPSTPGYNDPAYPLTGRPAVKG